MNENTKKAVAIPATIQECLQENQTSINLKKWAYTLKNIGLILLIVFIIIGIISGLMQMAVAIELFFSALFVWIPIALIAYAVLKTLAQIVYALSEIVQNTKVSADIAALQYSQSQSSFSGE